jgi:hypothetical protein
MEKNKDMIDETAVGVSLPARIVPKTGRRDVAIFSPNVLRPIVPGGVQAQQFGLSGRVYVGKPQPARYVRAYRNNEFAHEFGFVYDQTGDQQYLVLPDLIDEIGVDVRMRKLFTLVDWHGDVWLWPLLTSDGRGRTDPYTRSAHEAIEAAYEEWVRLIVIGGTNKITVMPSADRHIDPTWPADYYDAIRKGFTGRVIDSLDHPVVRRLRGQIS